MYKGADLSAGERMLLDIMVKSPEIEAQKVALKKDFNERWPELSDEVFKWFVKNSKFQKLFYDTKENKADKNSGSNSSPSANREPEGKKALR